MKVSQRADHLRLVLKHHTALDLCRFQVIKGPEGTIGNPSLESGHNRSQGCSSGE